MTPLAADAKVNVSVRVRPLIQREIDSQESLNWHNDEHMIQQCIPGTNTWIHTQPGYTFDYIFGQTTNTAEVYEKVVAPIVQNSFQGFNGTVLCYGQTSSGKTHTLYGSIQDEGIISLTAQDLFTRINEDKSRTYYIRIGLLEVYNEKVTDLLNQGGNIEIKEINGVVVPKDLKEIEIVSAEDMLKAAKRVQKERKIGETRMNKESSRSHTILRISIDSVPNESEEGEVQVTTALLNFVDLAGSEKASQTGAVGERFKEATFINKSLSTLSQVMLQLSGTMNAGGGSSAAANSSLGHNSSSLSNTGSQISKQPKYVNFRDSKLTRILQSSLNGNAFISLICNVTPVAVDETHSTLRFAKTAKKIKIEPTKNHGPANATQFRNKILELENLLTGKNTEVERLKQQLSAMQKFHPQSNQLPSGNVQPDRRKTMCPSMLVGLRNYESGSVSVDRPMTTDSIDFDFKIPSTLSSFRRTSIASPFANSTLAPESVLFGKGSHDEFGASFPKFPRIDENEASKPIMVDAQAQTEARSLPSSPQQQQSDSDITATCRVSKRKMEIQHFLINDEFQQKTKEWLEQKSFLEHETEFEMEETHSLQLQVDNLKKADEEFRAKFEIQTLAIEETNKAKENLEKDLNEAQSQLAQVKAQNKILEDDMVACQNQYKMLQVRAHDLDEQLSQAAVKDKESRNELSLELEKLKQEMKQREDLWNSQQTDLNQQLRNLDERLKESETEKEDLKHQLSSQTFENNKMQQTTTEYAALEERAANVEKECKSFAELLEKSVADNKTQAMELEAMAKEKEARNEECGQLKCELDSLQIRIDGLTEESIRLQEAVINFEKLSADHLNLKSVLENLTVEKTALQDKLTESEGSEIRYSEELTTARTRLKLIADENKNLKDQIKEAEDQFQVATTQGQASINEVISQCHDLQEKYDCLLLMFDDLQSNLQLTYEENLDLKERINSSEQLMTKYDNLVSESQVLTLKLQDMDKASAEKENQLAQVLAHTKSLEDDMESYKNQHKIQQFEIEERLSQAVVKEKESRDKLSLEIENLEQEMKRRDDLWDSKETELNQQLRNLDERLKESETEREDLKHQLSNQTLENNKIQQMTAEYTALEERALTAERECKSYKEMIEKSVADYKTQAADLESISNEKEARTQECAELKCQLTSLQSRIDSLIEDSSHVEEAVLNLEKSTAEIADLKSQLESLAEEKAVLLQKLIESEGWESRYNILNEELTMVNTKLKLITDESQNIKDVIKNTEDQLQMVTTQGQASMNEVISQSRELQEKYNCLLLQFEDLQSNLQSTGDENLALKERVNSAEELVIKYENLVSECQVLTLKLQDVENTSAEKENKLAEVVAQNKTLEDGMVLCQNELKMLQSRALELEEELNNAAVKDKEFRDKLSLEFEHLEQEMKRREDVWDSQKLELDQRLSNLGERLMLSETEREDLQKQISCQTIENNKMQQTAAEYVALEERALTAERERNSYEQIAEKSAADNKALAKELEVMASEKEARTEECTQLKCQLISLQNRIDAFTEESSRVEETLLNLEKLTTDLAYLKSEMENLNEEKIALQQKLTESEGSEIRYSEELTTARTTLKLITDENQNLKDQIKEAEDQLQVAITQGQTSINEAVTQSRELQEKYDCLLLKFEDLESKLQATRDENLELKERMNSCGELLTKYENLVSESQVLTLKLQDLDKENEEKEKRLAQVVAHTKALEDDIVSYQNQHRIQQSHALELEEKLSNAAIKEKESRDKLSSEFENLEQEMKRREDLWDCKETELNQQLRHLDERLKQSETEREDLKHQLSSQTLEKNKIQRTTAENAALEERALTAERECKSYKEIIEKALSVYKTQEKELETMAKEKEARNEECAQLKYQLTSLQNRIDALTEDSSRVEETLSNFEKLSADHVNLKSLLENLTEEKTALQKKLIESDGWETKYNNLNDELTMVNTKLKFITEENKHFKDEIRNAEDQLRAATTQGQTSINEVVSQSRELQEKYDCLLFKFEDLESNLQKAGKENLALKERVNASEELMIKYENLVSECHVLTIKLQELEKANAVLQQKNEILEQQLLDQESNASANLGISQQAKLSYEALLSDHKNLEKKLNDAEAEILRVKCSLVEREEEVVKLKNMQDKNVQNVLIQLEECQTEKKNLERQVKAIQEQCKQSDECLKILREELDKVQRQLELEKKSYQSSLDDALSQKEALERQSTQLKNLKSDMFKKVQELDTLKKEYVKTQAVCQLHSTCSDVIEGLNRQLMTAEAEKENIRIDMKKQQQEHVKPPAKVKPSLRSAGVQTTSSVDIIEQMRQYKIFAQKKDMLLTKAVSSHEKEVSILKHTVDDLEKKLTYTNSENENLKTSLCFFAEEQQKYKSMIKKPVQSQEVGSQCDILQELIERAKRGEKGLKFPKGFPNFEELMTESRRLKEEVAVLEGWRSRCRCRDSINGSSGSSSVGLVVKPRQKPMFVTPTSGAAAVKQTEVKRESAVSIPIPSPTVTTSSSTQIHLEEQLQHRQLINRVQPNKQVPPDSRMQQHLQGIFTQAPQHQLQQLSVPSTGQFQKSFPEVSFVPQSHQPLQKSSAVAQVQSHPALPPKPQRLQIVPPTSVDQAPFLTRQVPQLVAQYQQRTSPQPQRLRQQLPPRSFFDDIPARSQDELANDFQRMIDEMPDSSGN